MLKRRLSRKCLIQSILESCATSSFHSYSRLAMATFSHHLPLAA